MNKLSQYPSQYHRKVATKTRYWILHSTILFFCIFILESLHQSAISSVGSWTLHPQCSRRSHARGSPDQPAIAGEWARSVVSARGRADDSRGRPPLGTARAVLSGRATQITGGGMETAEPHRTPAAARRRPNHTEHRRRHGDGRTTQNTGGGTETAEPHRTPAAAWRRPSHTEHRRRHGDGRTTQNTGGGTETAEPHRTSAAAWRRPSHTEHRRRHGDGRTTQNTGGGTETAEPQHSRRTQPVTRPNEAPSTAESQPEAADPATDVS